MTEFITEKTLPFPRTIKTQNCLKVNNDSRTKHFIFSQEAKQTISTNALRLTIDDRVENYGILFVSSLQIENLIRLFSH